MSNLVNSIKWTKEEENRLIELYILNKWESPKQVPYQDLVERFPNRTVRALKAKLKRLVERENLTIVWEKEESNRVFTEYLEGKPLGQVETNATLEELESEINRRRRKAEDYIRTYAEERGLKVAKAFTLDTLNFFRLNYNTTSDFTRKALHSRIANG